jgi:hypothetical protein
MNHECELELRNRTIHKKILSRIFITNSGDLVVTDLWDEVEKLLSECIERNLGKDDSSL